MQNKKRKFLNKQIKKIKKNEDGNVLIFFVLFILPIMSFLLMISFDVASIYMAKRRVQDVIDDASLTAVRYFPYREHVQKIAKDYLNSNGIKDGEYEIKISNLGIQITYQKGYELVFSRIADTFTHSSEHNKSASKDYLTWPVSAYTFASPSISDYLILLDRNPNTSPIDSKNLWGSEVDWPAGNYFKNSNFDLTGDDARFYTEQCHNEIFSSLKEMVLDSYNYLGNFYLNSVGVGVFPGGAYTRNLDIIKEITKVSFNDKDKDFYSLIYSNIGSPTHEDCYNLSKDALANEVKYQFPNNSDFFVTPINLDEEEFEDNTSFQKNLWSIPSHKGYISNFSDMLYDALSELVSTLTRKDRKTVSEDVSKKLIIFSASLPQNNEKKYKDYKSEIENAIKNVVNIFDKKLKDIDFNTEISVVYVLLNNLYDKEKDTDIEDFRSFLTSLNSEKISFLFFSGDSVEDIEEQLFRYTQLHQRRGSVWR